MYLLFDIGGTNMRLAVSDGERITNKKVVGTPQSYEHGLMQFEALAKELIGDAKPDCIAGGFAAPIDQETGIIGNSVNLEDWSHRDFPSDLFALFDTPILFENDAALGALSEAVLGSGKDYDRVAFLTFGTGVGGSLVVNKRFSSSTPNYEPGHMLINFGESEDSVALGEYVKKVRDDETLMHNVVALGVHNVIVMWCPDVVILGGGLINHGVIKISIVERSIHTLLHIFDNPPLILSNNLGDDSVLYGAMECANRKFKE